MVVFLAADTKRMDELADSVRAFLRGHGSGTGARNLISHLPRFPRSRPISTERRGRRRPSRADVPLGSQPSQPDPAQPSSLDVERVEGASNRLAERVSARLHPARDAQRPGRTPDTADRPRPAAGIRLVPRVTSRWELWGYPAQVPLSGSPQGPQRARVGCRGRARLALVAGGVLALADSYDAASGRYVGLVLPSGDARAHALTDNTLIVAPSVAVAQATARPCAMRRQQPCRWLGWESHRRGLVGAVSS